MISGDVKFEQAVLANPNSKLQELWPCYKKKYSDVITSQGIAHQIFSTALKITEIVIKQEELKRLWMDLLKVSSFTLERPNTESFKYSFFPILELARSNESRFKINIVKINTQKDDIEKIAKDIDCIAQEVFGFRFGVEYNKRVILSPNTFALLAKCKQETVGILFSSYVTIMRKENKTINVLHFALAARKAEYPSIHLIKLFKEQENCIQQQFPNTDYLSLCTLADNEHAVSMYQELGFVNVERKEAGWMGKPTFFFIKKLPRGNDLLKPTYDEVSKARKREREKIQS